MAFAVAQNIAPWMTANLVENLLPRMPRICWLPEAVHHPALLHATLLAAAVHLNRVLEKKDLTAAIWLKVETPELVNESLVQASDELLLCVLIKPYFTVIP